MEKNELQLLSTAYAPIIKDLIEIAGGLTENADISNINRA